MRAADLIRRAEENVAAFDVGDLKRSGFIPLDGRYFPAVLYPPVPMYGDLGEEEFFHGSRTDPAAAFVVYAHVPFCPSRCRFCHFVSFAGISSERKDAYLDALEKEIDLYLKRLGMDRVPTEAINVGGGTATCLSPRQLERFLRFFTAKLDLGSCDQFTVDTDVSTLLGEEGRERLRILEERGVDRITIGAQVFDDALLTDMNRSNRGSDVVDAVRNAKDAGIDNICIDLIYGYPGQTPESWVDTLERTAAMEIDSFQMYRLRIKPHNLLPGSIAERHARSPGDFPSLEEICVMKELGFLTAAENGFSDERYLTLFSKSSRGVSEYHRKKFCRSSDVLGFGLAANNILGPATGIKTGNLEEYTTKVDKGSVPFVRGKRCTREDMVRRSVVGPLRNLGRIDGKFFRETTGLEFGEVFARKLEAMKSHGLFIEEKGDFALTRRGRFFVDAACIQFYHPDYIPFPASAYADGGLNPHRQPLPLGV